MNYKFKKFITSLAAISTLATVSVASANYTVSADKKHNKVKVAKKATNKDSKKNTTKKPSLTPVSNYPTTGDWYVANAEKLYNAYHGKGVFAQGESDGGGNGAYYRSFDFNTKYMTNDVYRAGWIIANVNGKNTTPSEANGGNAGSYNTANNLYTSGVDYANSNGYSHSEKTVYYDKYSSSWINE